MLFTGSLLVFTIPVLVVAKRKRRPNTARRFLVAAGTVGLICATLAFGSERLESQCQVAGNPSCYDYGGAGLQMLLVVGYVVAALTKAVRLIRD